MVTFLRFDATAFLTFLLELGILYVCMRVPSLPYLVSVAIAFILSTLAQYALCHAWVFVRSGRTMPVEYGYFMLILGAGLLWTLLLVGFFVQFLGVSVIVGRILAGAFIGLWDFYLNARFNFHSPFSLHRLTRLGQ